MHRDAPEAAAPAQGLGYLDPAYARSLAQFGEPRELRHSSGWIIERAIGSAEERDAMGVYPLFACRRWPALADDLREMRERGLVSAVFVTDSSLTDDERTVFRHFDLARPYKSHFLALLDRPVEAIVSRHHRYGARRAARTLRAEVAESPLAYLDEWMELHAHLRVRHGISALRAFSRGAFATLLAMRGVVLLRALLNGTAVGAQVLLMQGRVAHAHLAAFSDDGYRHGASYLLDWEALRYCEGRATVLNWGGGSGAHDADASGLARYKRGWSNARRQSYLLGAVLDRPRYDALAAARGASGAAYFPAYRAGEFG